MKKIMWIVSLIPVIITAIILQYLPDELPMHYNWEGEIDRWGSKAEQLIFPVAILAVTLFWQLLMLYYEKKEKTAASEKEAAETANNSKLLCIVGISEAAMFGVMHFFSLYGACKIVASGSNHMAVDIPKIVCILLGIMFIVLGNFMPKSKKNATVGVRIAWSMYNDNTWRKSNRFGAVALIVAGLLTIVTTVFADGTVSTVLMLVYLILATVITVVFSKKVFDDEKSLEK